jgi:hypothetical protein
MLGCHLTVTAVRIVKPKDILLTFRPYTKNSAIYTSNATCYLLVVYRVTKTFVFMWVHPAGLLTTTVEV